MVNIPGFKLIKNNKGKIIHVKFSMKHHAKIIEDIILYAEISKAEEENLLIGKLQKRN